MLRFAFCLLLAFALAGPLSVPSAAVAQDDGVFVDPDSPAEKEYALPIDKARREADPARRPGERIEKGAATAPLFGAGVGRAPSGGDAGRGSGAAPGARRGTGTGSSGSEAVTGARDAGASGLPRSDEVARLATAGPADGGATGTTLLVGGVGGAILLAGITAGLLLRRRS